MGDKIVISSIEFLYNKLFQIDLYNENKREHYRTFIEVDEFYELLNSAIEKGLERGDE